MLRTMGSETKSSEWTDEENEEKKKEQGEMKQDSQINLKGLRRGRIFVSFVAFPALTIQMTLSSVWFL